MVTSLENQVTASPKIEQHFTLRGLQWHQFKAIQASFEDVPGVRLFYCQGVLEIVTISKLHDAIRCMMGLLLGAYFVEKNIEFFPSGSYSQIVEGVVEYQADLSYCFGKDKDVPDLCVEVVITSGSPIKLQKYRLMGVPEVWFWEDGTLAIYHLQEQGYEQVSSSEFMPELDLSLLLRCILISSPLEAIKEFRKGISSND
ncbi:Uma2 family endonuclease [Kamptonema sp. UHCC 0994]|uniref:Uma2 family endonuclease n=1 Tax=Kamptonema sp. UHCC 0994 TaxID=3031329 RepID=UPI0023B9D119|nr:Uma2 family endonuclease [Kamptonema sp. UHCC 0994]MDF0554661.1 Uma2 family endonuclease [Kamptonema sp. UHCC 0994]